MGIQETLAKVDKDGDGMLDFDELQVFIPAYQQDEVHYFGQVYVSCDKDGNGTISALELFQVLDKFGWAPKTYEQQAELMRQLEEAKRKTIQAGVQIPEGKDVTFWVYLQLMRLLQDESDSQQEKDLQTLRAELRFSEAEVDQFRQIFRGYAKKNDEFTTSLGAPNQSPYILQFDSIKRVIASLGVRFSWNLSDSLERKLKSLDGSSNIDFFNFLRLMRWLLDTNFGRINDTVVEQLGKDEQSTRQSASPS